MITGFGCYIKYLAIKSHFSNEKYDYFKYNGQVRADTTSFHKRNDRYFFEKIAKKLQSPEEVEKFFLASLVKDTHVWIGEVLDDSALDNYLNWKKKIESITYTFNQDLQSIIDQGDIKEQFQVKDGQHPIVLKMYLKKKICIESLTLFNLVFGCFEYWDKQIQDRIVWPEIMKKSQKYEPFLLKYIGRDKIIDFRKLVKQKLGID